MFDTAEFHPPYGFLFRAHSPRRIALAVAGIVGLAGIVALVVAEGFTPRASVAKGLLYVAAAGLVLYAVTGQLTRQLTRAHALLAAVVESIGDGLLVLGRDRKIVYANPAAVKMLECQSAANLIGIGAEEFSRRYGVSYMNGALVRPDAFASQRAFTVQGPLHYRERLYPSPDRELVILCTASAVHASREKSPSFVVSVLHDITHAENLERDRDQLFAAAAHALKTPVAIIKANVDHMEMQGEVCERPSVAMIKRQCDRIDLLVRNLLVVSRARSHSLELHLRVLELGPLVEAVLQTMPDVPIRAELHTAPRVRADDERLSLAIRDLISETLRDAPRGAPLTLRLATNAWTVELSVQSKVLPISERTFKELGEYDDSKLSRCAVTTIVEAHGGSEGIDEHDGQRSSWMRLPLVGEDDHD